jgi:septal ring factor EnvC (AmiA/AmiB activator)
MLGEKEEIEEDGVNVNVDLDYQKMSKCENMLTLLRNEIDNISSAIEEVCSRNDIKKSVFDELISDVEELSKKHGETSAVYYADTLATSFRECTSSV